MTTTHSTALPGKATRSGLTANATSAPVERRWPHGFTFPALENLHCWISDVHTPPRVGRHRAPEPPKVSLRARVLPWVSR